MNFIIVLPVIWSFGVFSVFAIPRPLVIWHGLGDSYASPGMLDFIFLIKDIYPGIFVHSVFIDKDLDKDRRAGFYGNVNEQIDVVYQQLSDIPELQEGFDAMGFSQGGQFLRAYVERYNSPAVHNLITFGSQHMGISDIPGCPRYDVLCQVARRAAKQAVYSEWAQKNLVQAQYYRDPFQIDAYLKANGFLTSINNEIPALRNSTLASNLASIHKLVLVMFTEDKTVLPKETAWFGAEVIEDETMKQVPMIWGSSPNVVPMRLQPIYLEDWIGLRKLDERGGIAFETCKGEHMQMQECWAQLVDQFVGGENHVDWSLSVDLIT